MRSSMQEEILEIVVIGAENRENRENRESSFLVGSTMQCLTTRYL